jgi:predicted ATPase
MYISQIRNKRPTEDRSHYPYNIPSLSTLDDLKFRNPVTFIVGENGIGKSTLVEAIAINAGFNPEGGSRNFNFSTMDSHSVLFEDIQVIRTAYRNRDGYFLRAESFYNVATAVDQYGAQDSYNESQQCMYIIPPHLHKLQFWPCSDIVKIKYFSTVRKAL